MEKKVEMFVLDEELRKEAEIERLKRGGGVR